MLLVYIIIMLLLLLLLLLFCMNEYKIYIERDTPA
jgi:hypothetical protein